MTDTLPQDLQDALARAKARERLTTLWEDLFLDAPALQSLAIAQDVLITQLKADWETAATDHLDAVKALEAALARIVELGARS